MPSVKEAEQAMQAALEAMRREFSTVRTGKATPTLLDTVRVEAYGTQMPLNQVASINTPDPTLIVVQPFDQTLIGAIEKGILTADLGLNPSNDGNLIRVPIPPLNEERRKEYVKLLHRWRKRGGSRFGMPATKPGIPFTPSSRTTSWGKMMDVGNWTK
jgi:ribosome recycling factor